MHLLILLLRKQKQLILHLGTPLWLFPLYISRNTFFAGFLPKSKSKNRFRDEIYSELTLNNIGFGCYVCVRDAYKKSQTTCINVVNCKIVTETCQLFFLRCSHSAVIAPTAPHFRVIPRKRASRSKKRQLLLCINSIPHR